MAGVELATAYVSIVPSARGIKESLTREMSNPAHAAGSAAGARAGGGFMKSLGSKLKGAAGMLGLTLGVAAAFHFFDSAIKGAEDFRRKQLLLSAVLVSTGGAAGVTAAGVDKMSAALSKQVGVTRGTVLGIANMLLRYREVKNVGVDKVFDRATKAALDLSAATGRDGVSSARMLGKALNDPAAGIGALTRAGVAFTTQQKAQITTLAKSGDTLGAQNAILDSVAKSYGGAAAAVATPGQRLHVAFQSFSVGIGTALLPAFDKIASGLTNHVLPALRSIPDFVRSHWNLIGPIVENVVGWFRNAWQGIVNLWHALQPATTLLAGAFLGALRLVSGVLQTVSSALTSVYGVLAGHAGIVSAATVAILAMWGAWKLYGIASVAVRAITTQVGLIGTRVGLAKLAVSSMSIGMVGALGAVAIAVGVGVWLWNRHNSAVNAAKAAAAKAETAQKSLTDAITADNGALGENTRLAVAKQLQDSGGLAAAHRLGISTTTLTDAVLGNSAAYESVSASASAFIGTGKDNEALVTALWDSYFGLTGGLDAASAGYQDVASAANGTTTKLDGTTTAMQTQEQAAKTLKAALDELSGKALTSAQSELQLQSGLQSMTDAIKDNGKSLTAHDKKTGMLTKGALANRQAMLSAIQTINDHASAVFDSTGSMKAATGALASDEAMLRKAALAAGLNKGQVDRLIKTYAAVPGDVKTSVDADTTPAVNKAKGLPATVAKLPPPVIAIHANMTPAEIEANKWASGDPLAGDWGPSIPVKANTVPASLDIQNWINGQQAAGGVTLPLHLVPGGKVRYGATGGQMGSGWNVVGEQGPELISPSGMIYTNSQTQKMMSGAHASPAGPMRIAHGKLSISADSQGNLAAWVRDLVLTEQDFASSH